MKVKEILEICLAMENEGKKIIYMVCLNDNTIICDTECHLNAQTLADVLGLDILLSNCGFATVNKTNDTALVLLDSVNADIILNIKAFSKNENN